MHINFIDAELVVSQCKLLKSLAKKSRTMHILSHILLSASKGRVFFAATNLETMAVIEVTGLVAVYEPGDIVLPSKTFFLKATALGDESLEIKVQDNICKLGNMKLTLLSAKEFPKIPGNGFKDVAVIRHLDEHLDRILYAAGVSDTRTALNGVYFNLKDGILVASNGHILHAITVHKADLQAIVPVDTVRLLKQLPHDITIARTNGDLRFTNDMKQISLYCKPVEGAFPNYVRLMPAKDRKDELSFTVDRADFIDALKEVAKMADRAGVVISQGGHGITIEGRLVGEGGSITEKVKGVTTGGDGRFEVNLPYLLAALTGLFDVDEVTVRWKGLEPLVIKTTSEYKDVVLIMPLRIGAKSEAA